MLWYMIQGQFSTLSSLINCRWFLSSMISDLEHVMTLMCLAECFCVRCKESKDNARQVAMSMALSKLGIDIKKFEDNA